MKKAVLTTYYHMRSTSENLQYQSIVHQELKAGANGELQKRQENFMNLSINMPFQNVFKIISCQFMRICLGMI